MNKQEEKMMRELLSQRMPLGIYDELGVKRKQYESPKDAYKDVLMLLWTEFPRGYIDMALFINEHQQVPIRDAERQCFNRELYCCEIFNCESPKREQQLRDIFHVLLKHTGCDFDENSFKAALFEFDTWLIQAKVAERTKDGSIFKFIDDGCY